MEERLQKYLAGAGIASRRASEKLIAEGRVEVNGRIVTEQGVKIDPERDVVKVNGKPVRPEEELVYLLLNKPAGYVTTVSDPQGRPTVMDLLQDVQVRVFPVGRLDYETEGALLFTNDGELSFRMTHPKFELVKTYVATLQGQVSEEKLNRLRQGVKLEDGMTRPAEVRMLKQEKHKTIVEIKIHEGRKRQVKRMGKAIGHPVLALKRTAIGPLTVDKVTPGEYRYLTADEIAKLCAKLQIGDRTHLLGKQHK